LISHNNITVKYITDAGITVKDKIWVILSKHIFI
jgi:hypothetical protein